MSEHSGRGHIATIGDLWTAPQRDRSSTTHSSIEDRVSDIDGDRSADRGTSTGARSLRCG